MIWILFGAEIFGLGYIIYTIETSEYEYKPEDNWL